MPLIERVVTVSGDCINKPKNILAPIGTPISDLIDFCEGFKTQPEKIITGGPMMGFAAHSLWEPVMKTTGSIIAFTRSTSVHLKTTACVHCGKCVDACPHLLTPTAFTKALDIEDENERMARLEELGVTICIECGCCSFVCPANRPLMENNRTAKNALRSYKASKKDLK
jgi:electron transport complex protein RnfC